MKPSLCWLAASLLLSATTGCATPTASVPQAHVMVSTFDPESFAWAAQQGGSSVSGAAMLRTRGGDVKTCAGLGVMLVPQAPYSRERIERIYGLGASGFRAWDAPVVFAATDPRYEALPRKTVCGPDGRFAFRGLPPGVFYIIATVTWETASPSGMLPQGGSLMQRVTLAEGQALDTVVVPVD